VRAGFDGRASRVSWGANHAAGAGAPEVSDRGDLEEGRSTCRAGAWDGAVWRIWLGRGVALQIVLSNRQDYSADP